MNYQGNRGRDNRSFGQRSFRGGGGGRSFGPRKTYDAVCADCGKDCQVPFRPITNEDGSYKYPVYCRECYPKHKDDRNNTAPKPRREERVEEKSEKESEDTDEDFDDFEE